MAIIAVLFLFALGGALVHNMSDAAKNKFTIALFFCVVAMALIHPYLS